MINERMRCTVDHCHGLYEPRTTIRTVCHNGQVVGGDTLLKPDTAKRIEELLRSQSEASATAPVYEYTSS